MRMTFFAGLCLALSLSACGITAGTPPPATASDGPVITAPARSTNADERTLKLAFDSFDTALYAVDGLILAGIIKPGSEPALRIRTALLQVKDALNAADSALRAANAESYTEAIAEARAAYDKAKQVLQEIRQ